MRFPLSLLCSFCLVAGGALLATSSSEAQESQIRPQFQPGNRYDYLVETSFKMTLPSDGGPVQRDIEVQQYAQLDVSAVDATGATSLVAKTNRLVVNIVTPSGSLEFDSEDPATAKGKMGKHFSSSLSRQVAMTLAADGKLLSAKETGGGGTLTPLPGLPQFGDASDLKQLVVGLFQGLPPEAVAQGDEWEQRDRRELAEFGDMEFDITYLYEGVKSYDDSENTAAVISYRGAMRGDVAVMDSRPGSKSGERLGFDGSKLVGQIVFDPASRTVLESRQSVDMTVSVPGPDGATAMRLPVKQSVVTRLTGFETTQ